MPGQDGPDGPMNMLRVGGYNLSYFLSEVGWGWAGGGGGGVGVGGISLCVSRIHKY